MGFCFVPWIRLSVCSHLLIWYLFNKVLAFSSLSYNFLTCLLSMVGFFGRPRFRGGWVSVGLYSLLQAFPHAKTEIPQPNHASAFLSFHVLESSFQETGGLLVSQCYYYDLLYLSSLFLLFLISMGNQYPVSKPACSISLCKLMMPFRLFSVSLGIWISYNLD